MRGADALDHIALLRRRRVVDLGQRAVESVVLPEDASDGRLVPEYERHGRVVHLQGEGVLGLAGRSDAVMGVVHRLALP